MARYRNFTKRANPPLIGALLRRPVGATRRRILAELEARGFADIHPAHLAVFQHPGPDGLRPSQVAAAAGMTKQAMNHLLGQLESLGYLERKPLGERGTAIALTKRGRSAIAAIRDAVTALEGEWSTALGAERFRTLRSLLVDLNAIVDDS